jgi:hypothetical protein
MLDAAHEAIGQRRRAGAGIARVGLGVVTTRAFAARCGTSVSCRSSPTD